MRFAERAARFGAGLQNEVGGGAAWALLERARQDRSAERRVNGQEVILAGDDETASATAPAIDAAIAALEAGFAGYPPVAGERALRAAIAETFDAAAEVLRPRVRWRADNVVITSGAQGALFAALQVLVDDGDEVVAPAPLYGGQGAAIAAAGGRLRSAPLSPDRDFRLETAAIEAAITPRTRALLLTSPHNPSGAMLDADEMRAVAELAVACDLWVISDEVYGRLAFDRPHLSIAAAPGMAERTVVVDSVSKTHGMADWRIGWLIGPRDVARRVEALLRASTLGAPGFAQAGALAAVTQGARAADRLLAAYRRRRDLMGRVLAAGARSRPGRPHRSEGRRGAPVLRLIPPEGGLFAMIDARGLAERHGIGPGELAEAVYEETGVATIDGAAFGPEAAGMLRVSLALEEDLLADMSARIARLAAL